MTIRAELAIIGGGPAGLAAAIAAASRGVRVTIVDAGDAPGGATALHTHLYPGAEIRGYAIGPRVWQTARECGATLLSRAVAWGLFEDNSIGLVLGRGTPDERADMLHADAIILATGATDRAATFPGATLPGVSTTTAVLTMLHRWRVRPGAVALVVGSGPAAPFVVHALRDAGMDVQTTPTDDGLHAFAGLDGALARVETRAGDVFACDTLVLALGAEPATELARMRGCAMRWEPSLGSHIPVQDASGQTSVPHLFIAGDAAGMMDAGYALAQGSRAAAAVADLLGKPRGRAYPDTLTIPPGAFRAVSGVTGAMPPIGEPHTVCRCEEVTAADVDAAIAAGARTLGDVKRRTRAGMGMCQGRWCSPALRGMLATRTGQLPATLLPMTARPSVVPVPLGVLAEMGGEG